MYIYICAKRWNSFTAFRNSAPLHKDVHWLRHRCYMDEHKSAQYH